MYEQMMSQANVSVEQLTQPMRRLNTAMVDSMDKLVRHQIDACRAYTDLGLKQLRQGIEIKDVQDLQGYLQGQQEVLREVAERVQGDAQAVVGINQELANELRGVMEQQSSAPTTPKRGSSAKSGGRKSASTANTSASTSAEGGQTEESTA